MSQCVCALALSTWRLSRCLFAFGSVSPALQQARAEARQHQERLQAQLATVQQVSEQVVVSFVHGSHTETRPHTGFLNRKSRCRCLDQSIREDAGTHDFALEKKAIARVDTRVL